MRLIHVQTRLGSELRFYRNSPLCLYAFPRYFLSGKLTVLSTSESGFFALWGYPLHSSCAVYVTQVRCRMPRCSMPSQITDSKAIVSPELEARSRTKAGLGAGTSNGRAASVPNKARLSLINTVYMINITSMSGPPRLIPLLLDPTVPHELLQTYTLAQRPEQPVVHSFKQGKCPEGATFSL